jgi:DNA-binding transcriptional LysR family regulator
MTKPDFNLLATLDGLLAEGSVARAARRLRLSPSAMSRALARLRETTGDPLLVRAGRALVPTPRAIELRERVGQLVQDVETALGPVQELDIAKLSRTFRCGRTMASSRTSGRSLLLVLAGKRPACAYASFKNQTRKVSHFATAPSIWKLASSERRRDRK